MDEADPRKCGCYTAKKFGVQNENAGRSNAAPRVDTYSAVLNSLPIETVPILGAAVAIIAPVVAIIVAVPLPSFDAPVPVPIQAVAFPLFYAPIAIEIRATVAVPSIIAPIPVSVMIVIQFTTD
jgi:hypothetical protein